MFKSVFTKSVASFMLIILISFSVLSIILVSHTVNNSTSMKRESVENAADSISVFLKSTYDGSSTYDFGKFLYYENVENDISLTLDTVSSSLGEDVSVFITNENGVVLLSSNTPNDMGKQIPDNITFSLRNDGKYSEITSMNGFFSKRYMVSAKAVNNNDGEMVGSVFVCSENARFEGSVNKTIKALIVSVLWVMLAVLIAVYFISDRIISPLKMMSKAAKEFSQGNFDARVEITGQDEVAELGTAFNNMASTLGKNEEMRKAFLANISHDLRTPMTVISGFVEGMLNGAIPPEKYNHYLQIIFAEVKRLSRLVSSLLDISRLQAGDRKIVKSEFDICEMARQIIISLEQKLDSKKLDVMFDCDKDNISVFADRDTIYQVLYNICDNAQKFCYEKGKYLVKIVEKDKKVFVSVRNDGQGIAQEELPFVFDRFFKSDKSRGLDKSGVGLGLYIVKTIIDSHGEEIWVNSVYGEYCEFVFTLSTVKDAGETNNKEKFSFKKSEKNQSLQSDEKN